MSFARLALLLATGGTFTVAAPGTSQTTDSAAKSHAPAASDQRDTLFLRARRLVAEGNGAAGPGPGGFRARHHRPRHHGIRDGALLARSIVVNRRRCGARLSPYHRRISILAALRRC